MLLSYHSVAGAGSHQQQQQQQRQRRLGGAPLAASLCSWRRSARERDWLAGCLVQNERDDTVDDLVKSDFLHEPGCVLLVPQPCATCCACASVRLPLLLLPGSAAVLLVLARLQGIEALFTGCCCRHALAVPLPLRLLHCHRCVPALEWAVPCCPCCLQHPAHAARALWPRFHLHLQRLHSHCGALLLATAACCAVCRAALLCTTAVCCGLCRTALLLLPLNAACCAVAGLPGCA